MFRSIFLSQLVLLLAIANAQAQTTAKVLSVTGAHAAVIPSIPRHLLLMASGTVSDAGWENPRLVPYVYVRPPADGIWDFDFVADRVPGQHIQKISPIKAICLIGNPPTWVKGVRVHSSSNSKEVLLGSRLDLDEAMPVIDQTDSGSISLDAEYEHEGSRHCVRVNARVKLGPIDTSYELGRFCIRAGQDRVEGESDLGGGVTLHWELRLDDDELCFFAKACKDFGFPIGEQCTPEGRVCVEIQ